MKQKGFTLIELLVVVAIIGILAAVGVVAYNGYTKSAKESAVRNNFKSVVTSTIQGFLPPNSSVTGVRCIAAALAIIFPTATLPVKKI